MPGILPMKVIKVGTSNQTRIAQACDRCRSKKIRCDGIRPSCTQCTSEGFECKTSDKLSRRAFPRGYTESLEERVRALELEVRELKDLLDEKDEKIDMLSRIHSHSPQPMQARRKSFSITLPDTKETEQEKDDCFKTLQTPDLLDHQHGDSYFLGTSCGRTLIDAFRGRVRESGRVCADIKPSAFYPADSEQSSPSDRKVHFRPPPRLVSDQLINIFFQEWAPLFPVLHRPAFLSLYEEYVASPECVTDRKSLAQLNLVFGIAALSSECRMVEDNSFFQRQWQAALDRFATDSSLVTLQCLTPAVVHCTLQSDPAGLLKYKGLAVGVAQRLGLCQSQKRFAFGALTSETRKKVFWTLYTLDCFSAAQFGLPRLMRDDDVHCEYPVDADDEYITEKGFMPTLPGEFTKLSSALALFKLARVLAKVLGDIHSAAASNELSFRTIAQLSDELDAWSEDLAPHLRLQFAADKPSTNIISSRSPLLSLGYHYVRSLIHRPVVCASSTIGDRASSSIVTLASSAKRIIQIVQLLDERRMSFSFCLNRNEVITLSGFSLLFQSLDLERESKIMKDNQRLLNAVFELLALNSAPGLAELRYINASVCRGVSRPAPPTFSRHNSHEGTMSAPQEAFHSTHKQLKAIAARFTSSKQQASDLSLQRPDGRRATLPVLMPMGRHNNSSELSISSIRSEPTALKPSRSPSTAEMVSSKGLSRSEPTFSPPPSKMLSPQISRPKNKRSNTNAEHRHSIAAANLTPQSRATNLDYLSFASSPATHNILGNGTSQLYGFAPTHGDKHVDSAQDWERLLSSLDNGQTTIYDGIYGDGSAITDLLSSTNSTSNHLASMSTPNLHSISLSNGSNPNNILEPDQDHLAWAWDLGLSNQGSAAHVPQSVLSFSDESLTSGDDVWITPGSNGSAPSSINGSESYPGLVMPAELSPSSSEGVDVLEGLDGGFGL